MTTPRRPRIWVDTIIDTNIAGDATVISDLMANAAVVNIATRTVIRWIGRILVVPSTVSNAGISLQQCSVGIGVVSRDSFVAGGAAVPDSRVAADHPISGWVYCDVGTLVNQQDSGTVEAWHFSEFHFDIRTSRKVDRGIAMLKLDNQDLIAGTAAVKFSGIVRCLTLN